MEKTSILTELMSVIAARKLRAGAEKSYVASLMKGGLPKIASKISEEAVEVVVAAAEPGTAGEEHLVKEVADLVFHAMVLLGYRDLHWSQVEAELGRRFGVSGLDEKASRTQSPRRSQAPRRIMVRDIVFEIRPLVAAGPSGLR